MGAVRMTRKLISFAATRKLRYWRLVNEYDYPGGLRDGWGEDRERGRNNHYADIAEIEGYPSDTGRWVLIENSRYGQVWITLWNSPDEACSHHAGQEYAEDWTDAMLYDLSNGDWYAVEMRAVAKRIERGPYASTT